MQASESDQQVVALKQQVQQLQGKWRQAHQNAEKLSWKLWYKHSQVTLPSRKIIPYMAVKDTSFAFSCCNMTT